MDKLDINQKENRIVFKEMGKFHFIEMSRITHLTCDGYVTTIHTIENKRITVSKLLKCFEIELKEQGFLRTNHNTIVNSKNIMNFQCGCIRSLTLVTKKEIKISRRKMFLFKKYMMNKN